MSTMVYLPRENGLAFTVEVGGGATLVFCLTVENAARPTASFPFGSDSIVVYKDGDYTEVVSPYSIATCSELNAPGTYIRLRRMTPDLIEWEAT